MDLTPLVEESEMDVKDYVLNYIEKFRGEVESNLDRFFNQLVWKSLFCQQKKNVHIWSGIIADLIRDNPKCVLGLATGSTPVPVYNELIRLHKENDLSFAEVTTFNLDEYIGLSADHPCSYRYFMQSNF